LFEVVEELNYSAPLETGAVGGPHSWTEMQCVGLRTRGNVSFEDVSMDSHIGKKNGVF
jgi:hypothetical protein